MKAALVDERRFVVFSRTGRPIVIEMKLFKITGKEAVHHPEGYRVGWIAFELENPGKRVLFDSHPPKGIHFHIDADEHGTSFTWKSLEKAEQMFFEKVQRHFDIAEGELT